MKPFRPIARSLTALTLALATASALPAAERGAPPESGVATKSDAMRRDSQSASDLIGMTVKTDNNERVGKVEDLFVDLTSGRIVGVILSSGGFLGLGDALSIVQPSNLSRVADGDLRLDLTKERLAAAPRYTKGALGDRVQNRWSDAKETMRDRRDRDADSSLREPDRPHQPADADNTARNRRDRDPSLTVDPLDQSNRRSDVETTAKIRSSIVANDRLSTNAKNVKIVTRDGQVTLRGPVKSEEERRIIDEIAAQVAPGRVSSQLEVAER